MYGREMIYLTLYQGNNRIGNAGYVKVDIRDKDATFHFMFRKIPDDIRGEYPLRIMEDGTWKEGPGLLFRGGQDTAEKKSAPCGQIQQLQVLLEKGYRIEGKSKNCPAQVDAPQAALPKGWTLQKEESQAEREALQAEREAPQAGSGVMPTKRWTSQKEVIQSENEIAKERELQSEREMPQADSRTMSAKVWTPQPKAPQQKREMAKERELQPEREMPQAGSGVMSTKSWTSQKEAIQAEREITKERELQSEREESLPEKGVAARVVAAEEIREDKWEQILATYETIHPYGDGRVYVKLEPKDFVIMQGKYQHLVNNSFLLHGFYNYRYLILGKEQGKEYYLGVPGVFYEREKMVALMFGFEAFDCEGGNASPGGFGYYLRRVEL